MPTVTFSQFDIHLSEISREFEARTEADIRQAHGEKIVRAPLTEIEPYMIEALMHAKDSDQKEHEAELEALHRSLGEP